MQLRGAKGSLLLLRLSADGPDNHLLAFLCAPHKDTHTHLCRLLARRQLHQLCLAVLVPEGRLCVFVRPGVRRAAEATAHSK